MTLLARSAPPTRDPVIASLPTHRAPPPPNRGDPLISEDRPAASRWPQSTGAIGPVATPGCGPSFGGLRPTGPFSLRGGGTPSASRPSPPPTPLQAGLRRTRVARAAWGAWRAAGRSPRLGVLLGGGPLSPLTGGLEAQEGVRGLSSRPHGLSPRSLSAPARAPREAAGRLGRRGQARTHGEVGLRQGGRGRGAGPREGL